MQSDAQDNNRRIAIYIIDVPKNSSGSFFREDFAGIIGIEPIKDEITARNYANKYIHSNMGGAMREYSKQLCIFVNDIYKELNPKVPFYCLI